MNFEAELESLLPSDLPHRGQVVSFATRHLEMIVEINQVLNLTRIIEAREAVIKHVLDSVIPWRLFAGAKVVVDAGTGAGFPGIPLSIVLPETRFVLIESIQKKTRFVESVIETLGLPNAEALPVRAEEWFKTQRADILTMRAVAPLERAVPLFAPAIKQGTRGLLFKGPDTAAEIAAAEREIHKRGVSVREILRYELPDALGTRTIVEMVQRGKNA
jgi:16S rRNA (guanine527-N7)-methyltransferase